MALRSFFRGLVPDAPICSAGSLLTALGYETTFAFAVGASASGGLAPLTYAWTLVSAPAGSSKTTANIASPTSLTGATLDGFDRPGTYVFLLTTTDAWGRTGTARVSVKVGTAEGYMAVRRIRWATLANRNIKAEGDGAKSFTDCGTLNTTVTGTALMTSVDIVNGTGLVQVKNGSNGFFLIDTENFTALFPRTGRCGSYALLTTGTLAGVAATWYENAAIQYSNAANNKSSTLKQGSLYGQLLRSFVTDVGSSDVAAATPNTGYKRGLVIDGGLSVRAFFASGAGVGWGDDPVIDGLAPTWTGAVLQNIAPGGAPSFDWATDIWRLYCEVNAGTAFTDTMTDLWILWKP
jgi:hypothetical protein